MGCESSKSAATDSSSSPQHHNGEDRSPTEKTQPSVGFVMGNNQIEALKQAFREVDVNHDNSLSLDELRAVFKKQGGFSDKEIQHFLKDADKNGNRRVEFNEFVALITAKVEKTIKDLRVVFDSFDKDKSGALTKKELTDLLKMLDEDTSSGSKVEKAFKKIDENKDGRITFDEFVAMASDL